MGIAGAALAIKHLSTDSKTGLAVMCGRLRNLGSRTASDGSCGASCAISKRRDAAERIRSPSVQCTTTRVMSDWVFRNADNLVFRILSCLLYLSLFLSAPRRAQMCGWDRDCRQPHLHLTPVCHRVTFLPSADTPRRPSRNA